jgi:hypothetical protein
VHLKFSLDDFVALSSIGDQVYKETGSTLDSKTIIEKIQLYLQWLQLFDFNIIVIFYSNDCGGYYKYGCSAVGFYRTNQMIGI